MAPHILWHKNNKMEFYVCQQVCKRNNYREMKTVQLRYSLILMLVYALQHTYTGLQPCFTCANYIQFLRPQRSCGKVMFLHLSVNLELGGRLSVSISMERTLTFRHCVITDYGDIPLDQYVKMFFYFCVQDIFWPIFFLTFTTDLKTR